MARQAIGSYAGCRFQVSKPIPLHNKRLQHHGHNRTLELVANWGKCRGIPLRPNLLIKNARYTHPVCQPKSERFLNVADAFKASTHIPDHEALIDDVVTTGATTSKAAKALLAGGARRVDV